MFSRLKEYNTNKFQFAGYLFISTAASISKVVSSVGGWLFAMENAMPRFDGTMDVSNVTYTPNSYHLATMGSSPSNYSSASYAVISYGAICCGTLIILTVVPQTFDHYLKRDSVESERKVITQDYLSVEEGVVSPVVRAPKRPNSYPFFVSMGWVAFGFQTIALFNGSLKLFNYFRGTEVKDANDEASSILMLAMLNAGFQCLANYASNQKKVEENASSSEKILESNKISVLIIIDCTVAAMFAYMSTLGALDKIPCHRLGFEAVPESMRSALARVSFISSGTTRFMTNGKAIKEGFTKKSTSPNHCAGKTYKAVTKFVGGFDAGYTAVAASGAILFSLDPYFEKYQFSDVPRGSYYNAMVVAAAMLAAVVYGGSTYCFNTRSRIKAVLNMSIFSEKKTNRAQNDEMARLLPGPVHRG